MRAWLRRIRIPILYYHEIAPSPSKHVVSPGQLGAQLDWLVAAGFTALSMDDVLAVYEGRRPAPERAVALSFDDGRAGVRDFAAPALLHRGLPAILYVVTGWLDGAPIPESERYSDFVAWSDLGALQQAGLTIGSHGVSHANLKRMAPARAAAEVMDSRRRLEEELGLRIDHFSFPYGRRTRAVARAVREAGYRTAVVTGERCNGRLARLHRLYRLRVDGRSSLEEFQSRLLAPPGWRRLPEAPGR